MFTPIARFALLLLSLVIGIISYAFGWVFIMILLAVFSLSLLWGYYNTGTVYLALNLLRKGKLEDAEEVLKFTKRPLRLPKGKRAYYNFILAYCAREKDDFTSAKEKFILALDDGLKSENERAISLLALADIALIDHDKEAAQNYMKRLKGLKVKESLKPQINQMQSYLSQNNEK
ncbi:MAG TPA: hypothetical protein VLZ83_11055 [Edaphocola sp.]|nr:hypothetical protein [Edaphocola sp.]